MVARPEVLAPAGDEEALRAAIRAGADAVYFGLQGFNARARATNFDAKALGQTMALLRANGVRGYVTLNTLVFDAELPAVEAAVRACAEAGVDAVIVQDLGTALLCQRVAPELPIHASTQMTCTDAGAVELARSLGASRVILARELSLDDIAQIRRTTTAEIEVFVHGALCVAYSGQCLTSEAIGGRSANRGACAQACRLPYELVVDGALRDTGDRAYLLSPEDLETAALVPRLVELGVTSLKIEGRLKGPAYVAATTALYRRAIDAALGEGSAPTDGERRTALQTFSRGSGPGFLAGVDHQRLVEARACDHRGLEVGSCGGVRKERGRSLIEIHSALPIARGDGLLVEGGREARGEIGGRVWDVTPGATSGEVLVWLGPDVVVPDIPSGRRVFRTSDPAGEKSILARAPHKAKVDLRISGALGEFPRFEAATARASVAVHGDAKLEEARTTPLTPAAIREKMDRLGETPFTLGELSIDLPERALLPVSSLNRARRAIVEALLARTSAHPTTKVTAAELLSESKPPRHEPPPAGLFVLCRTLEQARAAVNAGCDGVYLDFLELTGTGNALRTLREEGRARCIGVAPPRIRKPGEEKIDKYLKELSPDAVLVRGLGALHEIERRDGGPLLVGDFSLNVTNRLSSAYVLGRGLAAFTPSFDLDAGQLSELLASDFAPFAEVVVHHPMPLFHMEHCVFAALLSDGKDYRTCGRPCEHHTLALRDRAGMDHPVEADVGCRNTVFHAAAQSAAGVVSGLQRSGVRRFRIELVREGAAAVERIVSEYRALLSGRTSAAEVWRALKTEGGYGVVRGSLRVLGSQGNPRV